MLGILLASCHPADDAESPADAAPAEPVLSIPAEGLDLGTVAVGCSAGGSLTIVNRGHDHVRIEDVAVDDPDLVLSGFDGPTTLGDAGRLPIELVFTPSSERSLDVVLRVTSDDPAAPVVEVPVRALAESEHVSLTVEVTEAPATTALFVVNRTPATDEVYSIPFVEALPSFFETLHAYGGPFRVAFLAEEDGVVTGDVPYVDETSSVDDAVGLALAMVSSPSGDNDAQLATLEAGIEANRAWLLDEGPAWADARLTLVGINNDLEQSAGDVATYLTRFRAYKSDPDDIVVHGVMGELPRGCMYAAPGEAFAEAAEATGGSYWNYCEEDWEPAFSSIAAALPEGGRSIFRLDGTPADGGVEVSVDGVPIASGWAYDAGWNAVVFDAGAEPPVGSTVTLDYILAPACPE